MKDLFIDVLTGEVRETETTQESIAQMKALQETQALELELRIKERNILLSKLGITNEEAQLLFG